MYKRLTDDLIVGSKEYSKNHKAIKVYDSKLNQKTTWMFETSMNTMMHYVNKEGIAILSAFRGNYDIKKNMKRHGLMKDQFKKNDVRVIEVDGYWVENYQKKDERHVAELSLAIPFFKKNWIGDLYESSDLSFAPTSDMLPLDKFTHFILKIAGIFNQDAVIIAHPTLGVYLHYKNWVKEKIGTTATVDKIGEAYTKLRTRKDKGRTFIFEGTRSPHNHIDAYRLKSEGIIF